MIDTHAHLNFQAFNHDWRAVVDRATSQGVEAIILVGTDVDTSRSAVEMAQQSPILYASVGIHPHHAKQYTEIRDESLGTRSPLQPKKARDQLKKDLEILAQLLKEPKVVAVGEIGLDYHTYTQSKRYDIHDQMISQENVALQKKLLREQLELAHTHQKPVIIHSRKAKTDVLDMLTHFNQTAQSALRGVFHCFEGSKKMTKKVIEAGFLISFTGNITYDHGRAEVSKTVPLEHLLLETDCPYMAPRLYSGSESLFKENFSTPVDPDSSLRSEPVDVKIIGHYHAQLRDVAPAEILRQTTLNARRLFKI